MKARTFVFIPIIMVAVAVMFIFSSCENGVTPSLYGTWVNSDYNGGGDSYFGKVDFIDNGDGTITEKLYENDFDTVPVNTVIATLTKEYTDSSGNLFAKFEADYGGGLSYILSKVHADNMTCEANWSDVSYPTEINSGVAEYNIYYRQ
jgi:hypothetical protein